MGSGSQCSKIDGFQGTHTNGGTAFVKDQKSYIVLMDRIMAIFILSSEALPSEETLEGFADPEGLISAMKLWYAQCFYREGHAYIVKNPMVRLVGPTTKFL